MYVQIKKTVICVSTNQHDTITETLPKRLITYKVHYLLNCSTIYTLSFEVTIMDVLNFNLIINH